MEVPGVQTDTPYYYGGNNYSVAVASGPSTGGFQFPSAGGGQIATTFNININEGDVPGGTAYSVVDLAVGAGPLLELTTSSSGAPTTYTLDYDLGTLNDLIDLRITDEGATTSDSWAQILGDTGVADTSIAEANLSMSSAGYGGVNQYLKITGSGSNNAANMEFSFTRPLYEQFTGDGGTAAVATSQNDVFDFEGGTWITTTMGTDKVTIDLTTPPLCYSSITTDNGTLTAFAPNQPLVVTNATLETDATGTAAEACLEISGVNDLSGSTIDVLKFTVVPQAHAGFGAQLVKIIDTGSEGTMNGMRYMSYSILVYEYNGDGTMNQISGTKTLRDFGLNSFDSSNTHVNPGRYICQDGQTNQGNSGCDISLASISYAGYFVNDVVFAQRISSSVWVTAGFPPTQAVCV